MPFFDTTGVDRERDEGPIWNAFGTLRDQLERLIVLNLAWSLQLVPGLVALAFPDLPIAVRAILAIYSLFAVAPASGLVYGLVARATAGEHLSLELGRATLRELALPSMRTLSPLYGLWSLLAWAALRGGEPGIEAGQGPLLLAVGSRLLLLLAACALYWGPLLAEQPELPMREVLRRSARLVLRYPGGTLLTGGAVLLAFAIGLVSVGGLFLIVPVLIALFQTELYRTTRVKQPEHAGNA